MTFVSYAQNFEDVRLWRAFSDVAEGRYLDIGAQEPIRDSVSYAFYLRGWRGVHVEPTPAYAAALRAARPEELVIEAAVSCAPGPIPFYVISETGLSTGVADLAKRHAEAGWAERTIAVPTVTLAGLFDLMGDDPIHWLKIDVEGMEADVLESWGNHPARPAALVIEATAPNTQIQTQGPWHDLVIDRGYQEVLFDGLSRYFVHESHADRGQALALSPNVFDGFRVPETHFTARLLVTERDAQLGAAQAQAAVERQSLAEASAAQLAAARAEAAAALAALQDDAEAEIGLARAEASYRAEAEAQRMQVRLDDQAAAHSAMLAQVRAALEAQLAATELALADTRSALEAQYQRNAALAREAGRLEGELAAQTAAYEARLGDAETVRHDLSAHLASTKVALAGQEARAEQLSAEIAALAQQLADSEAGRASVDRQLDEARQQGEAQAFALHGEAERHRAHIAWREGQLAQAARLLMAPPDPLAGWPRRVASLLARLAGRRPMETAAAHAASVADWQAAVSLSGPNTSQEAHVSLAGDEIAAIQSKGHREFDILARNEPVTSVTRLLAPHDIDFIWVAYQALLGRAPDQEGAAYYLARLRAGTHKLAILKQLRRSPEGQKFIPGVAGLDRAIRRHQRANLPLLGLVIRLMTGADGNSATHRRLRVIENEIGRLRVGYSDALNALDRLAASSATGGPATIPPENHFITQSHHSQQPATSPQPAELPPHAEVIRRRLALGARRV